MSSMGGERKIATLMFADLVGSTELAASSRQAWIEAGRPPLGAFATPAACAAAIYGYRKDAAAADDWRRHAHGLISSETEQRCGVHMMAADPPSITAR
jgi:hypothetical protein